MNLTEEKLAELEAICRKVVFPWSAEREFVLDGEEKDIAVGCEYEDAVLIATAVNLLPALIAEVRRLRGLTRRVAEAFEPVMDGTLAGDERAAVKACRDVLKGWGS